MEAKQGLEAHAARHPIRLAFYFDETYRLSGSVLSAEQAFAIFAAELARSVDRLVLIGRLSPEPGCSNYLLAPGAELMPVPYYESATRPVQAVPAMLAALARFWKLLGEVDGAWLCVTPSPLSAGFALLAALHGKWVVLGVRQDMPRYVRARHPGSRSLALLARLLEAFYRRLAKRCSVVVAGPDLARHYARGRLVLSIVVSVVRERDIIDPHTAEPPSYEGELRILSVGRLSSEKNPLLLADVLGNLRECCPRWRLVICGDGPMREALARRLDALGIAAYADFRGYVPIDGGLTDLYRNSHALLHVSWTEGLPQVLFEAFAARLPVVATDVGGISEAVGDSALLVPPGDSRAAARALSRLAHDEPLRARLRDSATARVRAHTLESESRRVADFLADVHARRG